jgi:hypothetical protein
MCARAKTLLGVDAERTITAFLIHYLRRAQEEIGAGAWAVPPGYTLLYPNLLLITQTPTHLLVELAGATPGFRGLKAIRQKTASFDEYLYSVHVERPQPALAVDTGFVVFDRLCFADSADLRALGARFPAAETLSSHYRLERAVGAGALVHLSDNAQFITFLDCIFAHRYSEAFRLKHTHFLAAIRKDVGPQTVLAQLTSLFKEGEPPRLIQGAPSKLAVRRIIASQFQGLYLAPQFRETTIGAFLDQHRDILTIALGARRVVYEPHLPWLASAPSAENKPINPDFLLERDDGDWDICDLKTAALHRQSLTKGSRSRRRFVDYVAEGLAQLSHYREYFTYPENSHFAEQKYSVRLRHPDLILIVGHYGNFDPAAVLEARRSMAEVTVIDYDTLVGLYINAQ